MAGNKASYHGPGLAIETLSIKESSSDLADENATLREEVAYLRQLLGVWQACPTCQHNPSATSSSSKSRPAAAGSKVHDAVDRILRQQQVLIAQQQRQLLALQVRTCAASSCLYNRPSTQVRVTPHCDSAAG
jgi:hypothetical protein